MPPPPPHFNGKVKVEQQMGRFIETYRHATVIIYGTTFIIESPVCKQGKTITPDWKVYSQTYEEESSWVIDIRDKEFGIDKTIARFILWFKSPDIHSRFGHVMHDCLVLASGTPSELRGCSPFDFADIQENEWNEARLVSDLDGEEWVKPG
ncbi:hypothetical protein CONPUDRAFT_75423 [Coniophora puteana RWD-64-598 SS2]|uniref:Uncharacterized protein n=1 Tax=Coniophora puteana (strain RWD-64-598) TaxID=741705 RepID=A0A5M3MEB6_CONPW|nr:uncharacterized protein CONPUDRAFT_75423 [Coniophora puteana RWD-64-598 SS2]EIW77568.1 hypothetical protein CONPUDRAFT_75423 [Coniophora puteana RWD-64-598 SS2]